MTKYTIIDIDLNINIDELSAENALGLTGRAGEVIKETIQEIKDLAGAVEEKKREKDLENDFLYKLFKDNNGRLQKSELTKLIPGKFKTFSTMIMRFGNYLRRQNRYEYLRKIESKGMVEYVMETMSSDNDTISGQASP